MRVRVIEKADGNLSVVYPVPKSKRVDETEEQWLERVFTKATPVDVVTYKDIDSSELPSRESREFWKFDKDKVVIDKVKLSQQKDSKKTEEQIQKEIRRMAIENLKTKKELPPDYKN